MGSLDPKINKQRVFELLRKRSVTRAIVEYSGGNDEGGTDNITLVVALANGEEAKTDLEVWYCGGYQLLGGGNYKRMSEPANEDQELSELLQGPVDDKYGSWAGEFSAYGTLTWDVETETAEMVDYVQSGYDESVERF